MDEWQMANTRKHVPLTQLHDWVGIYLCDIRTQVVAQQLNILKMMIGVNNVCSVECLGLQLIVKNSSSFNLLHAVFPSWKQSHPSKNFYSPGSSLIIYSP